MFCKVVSVDRDTITRFNGEQLEVASGVIADSTGCANFRFTGDNATKVAVDKVVAIRNGRSEVVEGFIRLELDKFGKISDEPVRPTYSPLGTPDRLHEH